MLALRDISQLIDHSLLHPALTDDEVRAGCELAHRWGVKTVCVKPYAVPLAKQLLKRSLVGICAVAGFPHGSSTAETKLREVQEVINNGASEIDMVINIGKARSGAWDYVRDEIRILKRACDKHSVALKVIFENDFLTDAEIVEACRVCSDLRVAFVKTSTGFGFVKQPDGHYDYQGATEHHIKLMRQHAGGCRIKAAGGIRTLEELLKFRDLGCDRIGTSSTDVMLTEAVNRGIK